MTERKIIPDILKRLEELGFSRKRIVTEYEVGPGLRADVAALDGSNHALVIVEAKTRVPSPDGEKQLAEFLKISKAKYGVLTDGTTTFYYLNRDGEIIEIPKLPRVNESLQDARANLRTLDAPAYKFWKLANILRSHGSTDYQISELTKLLLCKVVDETNGGNLFWRATLTPGENRRAKSELAELFESVKKHYPGLFSPYESIELENQVLDGIVHELASYSVSSSPDAFGKGFNDFLAESTRQLGQFTTPRNVTRFLVDMLRPRAKEFVIDPACGTGSFLLGCLDYVHQNSADKADEFAANRLYGMERMRDIVSIAKTNMILHGGDYSKVFCADSLLQLPDEVHAVVKQGGFDVVLVDPPLGSQQIEAREYRLGEHAQASVLFIERALQLAKPRGRIGVIVPENVLFAENLRHVRSFVMEKAFVRAIVSLPNGAYLPFTALRANALILEKKEHDQDVEYDVFMAEADAIDSLSVISQRFTEEW